MEFLSDPVILARIQFAFTAMYHFLLVPVSIGLGLIVAIYETRYYKSGKEEDAAASRFWIKIFTATFALGVATGITMEFSFGTNWADYSRFVGDIFGAPLAAEALLAFFLESTFLGNFAFWSQPCQQKVLSGFSMVGVLWFRSFLRCGSLLLTLGCRLQLVQHFLIPDRRQFSPTSLLPPSTHRH